MQRVRVSQISLTLAICKSLPLCGSTRGPWCTFYDASCSVTSGFCGAYWCFQPSHNGMNVRSNESTWKNEMDEETFHRGSCNVFLTIFQWILQHRGSHEKKKRWQDFFYGLKAMLSLACIKYVSCVNDTKYMSCLPATNTSRSRYHGIDSINRNRHTFSFPLNSRGTLLRNT